MKPLISVIIPVYNMEKYLCQCVDSVLKQTYTNLEIILIDDGSTDASGRICDQYAEKDGRVVVIHKKNGGISSVRNAGLNRAEGDYICFVDSDDYITENLCETVVKVLQKERVDIVEFGITLTDEDGKSIGSIENKQGRFADRTEILTLLIKGHLQNYLWNKIFARSLFDGVEFPLGYTWEDLGTTYKLLQKADGLCSIPEKMYFYRQRATSIIHNITEKALCDIFILQKRRYEDLQDMYPDVAELALPMVADSALRLYDRSLWKDVDRKTYEESQRFLAQNKEKIISKTENSDLKCYYQNKAFYNRIRILRHRIGNIIKRLYKLKW